MSLIPAYVASNNSKNIKLNAKKILVAYYSASGTTERLANIIAKETGVDIFVITPKQPYTPEDLNWNDKNSRVVREHEKDAANVSVEFESAAVSDFESYDTVFISYPIWWCEAAWVVDGFVKNNNFTGKNVIASCTSMLTGTGESKNRLEKLAKTRNWITCERSPISFSEEAVKTWLKDLGL